MPKKLELYQHEQNNWAYGQVDLVDDAVIDKYRAHTGVFTILGKSGELAAADGLEAVTGLVAVESLIGLLHQVTFTLTDVSLAVTDALAYASKKLFTFPAGRIAVHGVTSSLKFGVTTDRATTINDSASLTYGLGSAAASNITLATTMIDILPKTTQLLDGAVAAYTALSKAALAAEAQLDGTTTAIPLYLNVGFETNTDIDANGTLKISGSFTVTYTNLGDY